jgi:hypothetical protein
MLQFEFLDENKKEFLESDHISIFYAVLYDGHLVFSRHFEKQINFL